MSNFASQSRSRTETLGDSFRLFNGGIARGKKHVHGSASHPYCISSDPATPAFRICNVGPFFWGEGTGVFLYLSLNFFMSYLAKTRIGISCPLCLYFCICNRTATCIGISSNLNPCLLMCYHTATRSGISFSLCVGFCMGYCTVSRGGIGCPLCSGISFSLSTNFPV